MAGPASSDANCLTEGVAREEGSQGRSLSRESSLSVGQRIMRARETLAATAGKGKGKSRLGEGRELASAAGGASPAVTAPGEATSGPPLDKKLSSKKRKQEATGVEGGPGGEKGEEAEPKSKKARKVAEAKPSKRVDASGKTVRYSQQPSIEARERIERALPGSGHRLYLLATGEVQLDAGGVPSREFKVLGNSQNVYTVSVGQHPSCDCPDAAKKRRLCKHHYFVMLRVLRLSRDDPAVWQKALLPQEAAQVLGQREGVAASGDVLANPRLQQAYAAATTGATGPQGVAGGERGRKSIEGDCPICFDELERREQASIAWCKECGNNVHRACLEKWCAHQAAPTCVICRAPWPKAQPQSPSYINLGHADDSERGPQDLATLYGEQSAFWINRRGRVSGTRQSSPPSEDECPRRMPDY